jgi:two-component system sensor histidine kinase YcbA
MKWIYLQVVFVILATAITQEIKVIPFGGDFRFGLGVAVYLLLLLQLRNVPLLSVGLYTGGFIMCFRLGIDYFRDPEQFVFASSFVQHLPAFFFYPIYSYILMIGKINRELSNPVRLSAIVTLADFTANLVELIIRSFLFETVVMDFWNLVLLLIVAVVRSYFIVGLVSSFHIRKIRAVHEEQRKRIEKMLSIGSEIYMDTMYLKKSMKNIEEITARSYELYRRMKDMLRNQQTCSEEELKYLSAETLRLAQEFHEVKKDSQRILAGLLKMHHEETETTEMSMKEIVDFVIRSNRKYAEMLGKEIQFDFDVGSDLSTKDFYALLSILNNLVANAVEAIERDGHIYVSVQEKREWLRLNIIDDGCGISEKDQLLIFEPGFTTKFDLNGVAATGIGLSSVKDIINKLGGDIKVTHPESQKGTKFVVCIPKQKIRK